MVDVLGVSEGGQEWYLALAGVFRSGSFGPVAEGFAATAFDLAAFIHILVSNVWEEVVLGLDLVAQFVEVLEVVVPYVGGERQCVLPLDFGGGYAGAYLGGDESFAEDDVGLGHDVVGSVEEDGEDVDVELLSQEEGAFVEAADGAVGGACAFGEYHYGIAPVDKVFQLGQVGLVAVADGVELGVADDGAVDGVVPHPVVGEDDHLGGEHKHADEVEMGLVVADDDGGALEGFAGGVLHLVAHIGEQPHGEAAEGGDVAVEAEPFLIGVAPDEFVEEGEGGVDEKCGDEEYEEGEEGVEEAFEGDGDAARFSFVGGEPAVDEWREVAGHEDDGGHADEGDLGEGTHGRVFGEDEDADADEHEGGGDDDAAAVTAEALLAVGVFVHETLGDEDGVVVALAEDEGGEDDVDNVEFDSGELHHAEYPQPADGEGNEGEEGEFEPSEGEPEEEENDEAADIEDVVEVVAEGRHKVGAYVGDVEDEVARVAVVLLAECRFGGFGLLDGRMDEVHHLHVAIGAEDIVLAERQQRLHLLGRLDAVGFLQMLGEGGEGLRHESLTFGGRGHLLA